MLILEIPGKANESWMDCVMLLTQSDMAQKQKDLDN